MEGDCSGSSCTRSLRDWKHFYYISICGNTRLTELKTHDIKDTGNDINDTGNNGARRHLQTKSRPIQNKRIRDHVISYSHYIPPLLGWEVLSGFNDLDSQAELELGLTCITVDLKQVEQHLGQSLSYQ